MAEFVFFSEKIKERFLGIVSPLSSLLARLGVHPNGLSLAGLILSVAAGFVYSTGSFSWGALVVAMAGICDVLDGQLARQTGKNSRFGAFFDSTLDRFGEIFIFLGFAWHFSGGPFRSPWAVIFIILATTGSLMVSYTRARAEGLGIDCKVGWMQRPERFILLILGSLSACIPSVGHILMVMVFLLLAVLTNFTAFQRMVYVKNQLLEANQTQ